MASLADETPEGRSILELGREKIRGGRDRSPRSRPPIAFSATTRVSGLDTATMHWRKGAVDAVYKLVGLEPKDVPAEVAAAVDRIARSAAPRWPSAKTAS